MPPASYRDDGPALPMPTLGEMAAMGRPIQIWCNRCGRARDRDALTLSLLLGRQRPVYGLWRALWCMECGARGKVQGEVYSRPEPPPYVCPDH